MLTLRHYTLLDILHAGSRTVLYRGVRDADGAPVVVKTSMSDHPSSRELGALSHEHDILSDLQILGVAKVCALEKVGNRLLLVLERARGQALDEILSARRVSLEISLRIGSALAGVLEGVHRRQVIHKDIKPSNIVFDEATGELCLIDFGIASRLSQETQQAIDPEALEGTLAYISPEQTGRMNRVIDRRTDFYSLGITLYQLLTGETPFSESDAMALVHCHIARAPPPPHERAPETPEAVSRIVMKLLAKTAEDRYQSARGLKEDLDNCLRQLMATGSIQAFPLGEHDDTDTLRIPEKLYGRAAELEELMAAYGRAVQGGAELLLVTGYAGIGKSALVNEIHKGIAHRGGYFVSGKFDQLNRSVPYASIAQAFRALIRQILTEREGKVARWKQGLAGALGHGGQVLIDLIPELELIIGPQPGTPALGPAESQNRFNLLFKKFVGVFADEGHPLVLFLDDLQWADPASLKLLQALLADTGSGHLLVLGAYRDNEVDIAHPLRLTVDELRKLGANVREIALTPLSLSDVEQLLEDALRCDRARAAPLAAVLLDRTQNNPFFLRQLLNTLNAEQIVRFDAAAGAWTWDLEAVRSHPVTANVVDFMAGKIQRLAPEVRRILELAACIGHTFDLRTLSVIYERSPSETADVLWSALCEGLVLPLDASYRLLHATASADLSIAYRFLHDRVQQAAYSLIEDSRKQELHLRVGRLMRAGMSGDALDRSLFDVVNHLNLGAALIETRHERTQVAELNLAAGRRAKAAAAHRAAADHLRAGMDLLPDTAWQDTYDLTLALHRERAEAEYLSGAFDRAEALYPVALANARTEMDKVEIHFVQATQYQLEGRNGEAVRIHLAAARLLGWPVPDAEDATRAMLEQEILAVPVHLGDRRIEDLVRAPKMTSPEMAALMRLLQGLFYAAYVNSNQTLASLTLVKMTTISLEHGSCELSPFGYVGYGIVSGGMLGDYRTGHRFGRMAINLCDQFDNMGVSCKANFLFAADVNSWNSPISTSDPYYDRAYELGVECGDWVTAGYTIIQSGSDRLTRGKRLDELKEICLAHLTFLKRAKNHDVIDLLRAGVIQPLLNLKGLTNSRFTFDDGEFNEAAYVEKYAGNPYHLAWLYYAKIRSAYLFRDAGSWPGLIGKLEIVEKFVPSHSKVPETFFYVALIRLASCASASGHERDGHLAEVGRLLSRLTLWAENCPENIRHKVLLVEAERARVEGRSTEAMALYEDAIESARVNEYKNNQALASELYGEFWMGQGRLEIGRLFLRKALVLFDRWGAGAKVKALSERYPGLATPDPAAAAEDGRRGTPLDSTTSAWLGVGGLLDLATMLQAGQAISSGTALDKVVDQLMRIVLSSAGANRGVLILERGGELLVEATISVDPDRVATGIRTPLHEREDLAVTVVEYVARVSEPLALGEAACDPRFAADPYISAQKPRSILCLPLTHQGQLTGVLYLENQLALHAFGKDRIQLLSLLSSHAAVAVQNALLYTSLEEVSERLRQANDQLERVVAQRTEALREANGQLERYAVELVALNQRLLHELEERARTDVVRAALQEKVIRMQRMQLAELSTPLIPITDDVMVMPLIGSMDAERAQQVLETVLEGAQRRGAKVVLIDVTGMKHIDSDVASALIRTANALRLLGAQAVLTGIRPEVAQTLVALKVDLRGLVVQGTLQGGIAYATGRHARHARPQRTI